MSGVEVATERIVRAWRRAETTELWLRYVPARRADDQLEAVTSALWAANAAFDETDATEDFASADGPWEDPLEGTAVQILLNRCGSETALRDWLTAFGRAMDDVGAAGTLKPQRERDYPSWAMPIPWPQLTAFIAYDMEGPPQERALWNVAPEATARIAALDRRNVFPGAESYIGKVKIRRANPEAIVTALERILLRDGIVHATHLRPDPPRLVHAGFLTNGQAMRVVYDPSLSWRERLDDGIAFITALPDITTLAFVQYATGTGHGLIGLETGSPPLPAGSHAYHFDQRPERLIDQVPDARGVMVLTDAHLERADDLSGWSITSLGSGRHLVQAADLAAWFARPVVGGNVLAAARAAFGPMIWRR